jgi:hypothetical protein
MLPPFFRLFRSRSPVIKLKSSSSILLIPFLLSQLALTGCKPDSLSTEIYTEDLISASNGNVIQVPVTLSFSMLGNDDQNLFDRVKLTARRYTSPRTTFSESKGSFGDKLTIQTEIPLGTPDRLRSFFANNPRLLGIEVSKPKNAKGLRAVFIKTDLVKSFDAELRSIDFMLSLELPASSSEIRILSDSKTPKVISGTAVFVAEKPYLKFETTLNKRESTELIFKGTEGSVYYEIDPEFNIR